MKRFSPQNGRFGGHFRNIFESPSAKSPGPVRAPSQLFAFRRKKQILPKSPFSSLGSAERTRFKNVPKKWRNHTSHSAERTIFSRSNVQKSSDPQKERIFDEFIKTETDAPKREIAETLEKLGKNDPTEAHVATRDHSTAG